MPTNTFNCTAANDGGGEAEELVASGWPVASPYNFFDVFTGTTTDLRVERTLAGAYYVGQGFVRFDTSSLPDNESITSASLELYLDSVTQADAGRSLLAQYYDFGGEPVVEADFAITTTFDAFSVTWDSLGAAGSVKTITISDLSGISKTGFTGLRLKADALTGAPTPTGNNNLIFASTEHATGQEPRLVVTYTESQGTSSIAWTVA